MIVRACLRIQQKRDVIILFRALSLQNVLSTILYCRSYTYLVCVCVLCMAYQKWFVNVGPANVWLYTGRKKAAAQWTTSIYCDGIVWARRCVICVCVCVVCTFCIHNGSLHLESTSFMEEATKTFKIHVKKTISFLQTKMSEWKMRLITFQRLKILNEQGAFYNVYIHRFILYFSFFSLFSFWSRK